LKFQTTFIFIQQLRRRQQIQQLRRRRDAINHQIKRTNPKTRCGQKTQRTRKRKRLITTSLLPSSMMVVANLHVRQKMNREFIEAQSIL
jgi:hypothetical protein